MMVRALTILFTCIVSAFVLFGVALLLVIALGADKAMAGDETCRPEPITANTPSGLAGCTLDGPTVGKASWYHGTVAAAQWCVYPWKDCQTVSVRSNRAVIVITPGSFCDCKWTTDRRLIDLTPDQFTALGIPLSAGLAEVTVTPVNTHGPDVLADTAASTPELRNQADPILLGWAAVYALAVFAIFAALILGRRMDTEPEIPDEPDEMGEVRLASIYERRGKLVFRMKEKP